MSWNVQNITCLTKLSHLQHTSAENKIVLNTVENTHLMPGILILTVVYFRGIIFALL